EGHRRRSAAEDLVQRLAGLPKGEVERGGVEGPAPVEARDVGLRGHGEEVERVGALAELGQRGGAGEVVDGAGLLEGDVILGLVDDVLAHPLETATAQMDDSAQPLEAARHLGSETLEPVPVDLEGQLGKKVERAHRAAQYGLARLGSAQRSRPLCSRRATSSSSRSSSSRWLTASSSTAQYSTRSRPSLTRSRVSRRPASPESSRRMISSTRATADS